tara:strand:+ start:200 stop:607 length:408 start_codon:yes stop_codon:yes gene_type:complete
MSQTQVVVPSESKQEISPGDKLYDESRKQLLDKVGKLEINTGTIITILRFAMEVVEATQLKGPAQRQLCTKLVKDIVIAAPLSGEKEKLILDMIDSGVLDNTIELVVDATHGQLDINAAVGVASGCFSAISKNFC